MARWQYPSKVEGAPPPLTFPDKWTPRLQDNRRSTIFPIAILVAGMFFVNPVAAEQEAARKLPEWHTRIEQPYPAKKKIIPESFFGDFQAALTAPAEVITPDKWLARTNEPYLRRQASPHLYPYFFKDNLQPLPDGIAWHPETNGPRWDLKRNQFQYPSVIWTQFVEIITVDKWHPEINQPYFRKSPKPEIYPFLAFQRPFESDITMDRWFRESARPVWKAPRLVEYPAFFIDPTAFTIVSVAQERIFLIRLAEQSHQGINVAVSTHQLLSASTSEFFRVSFRVKEIG